MVASAAFGQTFVLQVQALALSGEFGAARTALSSYRKHAGVTSEYLEALSWLGRGELGRKRYPEAEANAREVRALCLPVARKIDSDAGVATALGASIEVQAQAAAAQGRRDEAVVFLRGEAARWRATSIRARIQKNLNLLDLEGKPAPALQVAESVTAVRARALAEHKGHPVLIFFWAHWCADCKQEIAVIEKLQKTYRSRGLDVVAPTQHYGYAAGGADVPRAAETRYIREVQAQYYAGLGPVEMPISEENFAAYGVSTTPTLVLLDRGGVVRMYHPGALPYDALSARVESVTKR